MQLQKGLDCGGAYMKLLADSPDLDITKVDGSTPYVIMFGPDKCGLDDKV